MSRKYVVRTFGCQMNQHDSERIAGLLDAEGLESVQDESDADVIVLNTCCIRENADNKLYGTLGHLKTWKSQDEGRQIVVAGCLSQKDKNSVQVRAPYVDVVLGTHNVHRITELMQYARTNGSITEIYDEAVEDEYILFPSALPARRGTSYNAWVTIQIGCDNTCAYCIVPAVRGKEISRPMDDIVREVTELASRGVTEITLLGQNVNSFGRDTTLHARQAGGSERVRPLFAELLTAAGSVGGIRRVRFMSPHPKDMRSDVLQAMASTPAVVEHLHYPLQSGSDRVLALMHRGYTADRFLEKLREARALIPDLAVTSDFIVGFPGETEDDFVKTLEVAAEADFDATYPFIFSARPGTEAAGMTSNFVDPDVMAERFARLNLVVERSALRKHQDRVGRIEEVVVEGPSRRGENVTSGRTRQSKLVHFVSPSPLRAGSYASIEITRGGRHHLEGELREVLFESTHRVSVPFSVVV